VFTLYFAWRKSDPGECSSFATPCIHFLTCLNEVTMYTTLKTEHFLCYALVSKMSMARALISWTGDFAESVERPPPHTLWLHATALNQSPLDRRPIYRCSTSFIQIDLLCPKAVLFVISTPFCLLTTLLLLIIIYLLLFLYCYHYFISLCDELRYSTRIWTLSTRFVQIVQPKHSLTHAYCM
jgi:hypothetical protein